MPTDATGTPTALGIPKYNTNVDAPSGLGFNAAMDEIDTLIGGRIESPASPATGDVPVWNGTDWVKSSTTKMSEAGIEPGDEGDVLTTTGGVTAWGAAGSLTLIDDHIVSGSVLASYDTNTRLGGVVPTTYKDLVLVVRGKVDAGTPNLLMRFNNSSAASYYWQEQDGRGAVNTAQEGIAQTEARIGGGMGSGSGGGNIAEISIPNYNDTNFAMSYRVSYFFSSNNSSGSLRIGHTGGFQGVVGPVTRIALLLSAGNFAIGTRFSLYGRS
jgi:hypothetical protein